jgi:hypothetical protein
MVYMVVSASLALDLTGATDYWYLDDPHTCQLYNGYKVCSQHLIRPRCHLRAQQHLPLNRQAPQPFAVRSSIFGFNLAEPNYHSWPCAQCPGFSNSFFYSIVGAVDCVCMLLGSMAFSTLMRHWTYVDALNVSQGAVKDFPVL